jgi:hypothetical protein
LRAGYGGTPGSGSGIVCVAGGLRGGDGGAGLLDFQNKRYGDGGDDAQRGEL